MQEYLVVIFGLFFVEVIVFQIEVFQVVCLGDLVFDGKLVYQVVGFFGVKIDYFVLVVFLVFELWCDQLGVQFFFFDVFEVFVGGQVDQYIVIGSEQVIQFLGQNVVLECVQVFVVGVFEFGVYFKLVWLYQVQGVQEVVEI